ncbi:MAG: hypothetical protein ABW157_13245 [Candidatus Thiodiazotropha sp. LLP2]
MIRHTIAKRQKKKLREVKEHLKKMSCVNVHDQGRWLRSLVNGVFNYLGVPENHKRLDGFRTAIPLYFLLVRVSIKSEAWFDSVQS